MTFLWYFMQTANWQRRHWDPNINLKTRVSIFLANCCMASSLAYDLRRNFSQTAAPHPPTNRPPEARKIHESKISAVLTCSFKTAFLDSKPFLVGGWTTPFEIYACQIGSFLQVGMKITNIWNHHLVFLFQLCFINNKTARYSNCTLIF